MSQEIAEMWANILGGRAKPGPTVVGPGCWSVEVDQFGLQVLLGTPKACFDWAIAQAFEDRNPPPDSRF